MELSQLRYVIAVVETGNFTRASERLNIAQPSLSQQVIKLEKELGHKLFHRLGRRAVLTEAGEVFIERARRILFEAENAAKELSDHPALERRITIGSIPTVAPYLIPGLIALHPNLQIDLREDFSPYLMRAVVEGELDLAIAALPLKNPRISIEPLLVEPLLLVVGKTHPLATQARVRVTDLAKERFVMLGSSSSLAAQVKAFCGDHHFEPRIGFRCAQVATVKALVGTGAGVSILPRVAQSPEDEQTLKYLHLHGSAPTRELAVFRHLQRYQSRGAEQFLAVLRTRVRELVP
jgi:LysR family hydrogen peroxide-inducible transcriptional activator